jgi:anti-sigma B factor antagonist
LGQGTIEDRANIFMEIQSTKFEKAVVVKVSGRMDAENAPDFQSACEQWIAKGERHLLLNLVDLQYISSMGLSAFMAVAKALQPKGGSVILCHLQGLPKQVFELTRLIGLFPVFPTTEAALASLA